MKILIYIDSMNPAGGIERVVSKHISFFSKKYSVLLLTKDDLESFYILPENITIRSLNIHSVMNMNSKFQRIFQTLNQLFTTRKKLKLYKSKHDLIYCTHIRNLLELYISGIDLKNVIVTEHGSYYGYNRIYKLLKKFLYPKCKYIVVPTTMDYEIYKLQGSNAFYIPNPLSFYNDKKSKLDNATIVNIGRLTDDKRQDVLLEIWNIVSKKYPNWKLKIVGKGECKSKLINIIEKYNLEESVKIIDPVKDIENIFLNSSIFAFTSKYEGFGMVLAEAMSCGVPCVCFDIPSGPRDIIINNEDGFLIEDNNINNFVEKLKYLISKSEKRIEMGSNAKENIQRFRDNKIEKQWIDLLEGIETK